MAVWALAELGFGSVTTLKIYPGKGNWEGEEFKDRVQVGREPHPVFAYQVIREASWRNFPEGVPESEAPGTSLNMGCLGQLLTPELGGGT